MLNVLELTGRARTHITQIDDPRCALHHDVVQPFLALRAEAATEGIDLRPLSSFRDFQTQVDIWNRKFRGERTLYNRGAQIIDPMTLSGDERVSAILKWSALPGTSRHHWGTEIDVFDQAAVPEGYRVQLLPEEFSPGGVFGRLALWLDAHLERFGFFRPYDTDRGGVSPEPWHISFAQVSSEAQSGLTVDVVANAIADADLMGREFVEKRLSDILRQYVANVAEPPVTILADITPRST